MAPIREFICGDCAHQFEEIVHGDESVQCPHCESGKVHKLISAHGGYSMSSGGSSTRPKGVGSFKGKVKR